MTSENGMTRRLLNALIFFPSRTVVAPTSRSGPAVENLHFETVDGERLHAWWASPPSPRLGHVLVCHGNAGNITSRAVYARLLLAVGFGVMLFDYRGYGHSSGSPSEEGTYRDARAARTALLARPGVDPGRVFYLGESLGGAVALELATHHPPAGLILQSTFTSVRDMAGAVYPAIPRILVPDAYPSRRLIARLDAPLLVLHGDGDEIVPLRQGRALYDAAPGPKRLEIFNGARHNDLLVLAGDSWATTIAAWAEDVHAAGRA